MARLAGFPLAVHVGPSGRRRRQRRRADSSRANAALQPASGSGGGLCQQTLGSETATARQREAAALAGAALARPTCTLAAAGEAKQAGACFWRNTRPATCPASLPDTAVHCWCCWGQRGGPWRAASGRAPWRHRRRPGSCWRWRCCWRACSASRRATTMRGTDRARCATWRRGGGEPVHRPLAARLLPACATSCTRPASRMRLPKTLTPPAECPRAPGAQRRAAQLGRAVGVARRRVGAGGLEPRLELGRRPRRAQLLLLPQGARRLLRRQGARGKRCRRWALALPQPPGNRPACTPAASPVQHRPIRAMPHTPAPSADHGSDCARFYHCGEPGACTSYRCPKDTRWDEVRAVCCCSELPCSASCTACHLPIGLRSWQQETTACLRLRMPGERAPHSPIPACLPCNLPARSTRRRAPGGGRPTAADTTWAATGALPSGSSQLEVQPQPWRR